MEKVCRKNLFFSKVALSNYSNIKIAPHHRCFLNYVLLLENSKIYAKASQAVFSKAVFTLTYILTVHVLLVNKVIFKRPHLYIKT